MGEQFTLLGDTLGVDRELFDDPGGAESDGCRKDQREEQIVASGNLCDEEDRGHRSLHHTGHQPGHPHKDEILLWHGQRGSGKDKIERSRNHESGDRTDEKGRTESTSDTSARIGQGHREDLENEDQEKEHRDRPDTVRHERQRSLPVKAEFGTVEKGSERTVAFSV